MSGAFAFVQAQVQALEPFPTRAGGAAGLMGALKSFVTSVIAVCRPVVSRQS